MVGATGGGGGGAVNVGGRPSPATGPAEGPKGFPHPRHPDMRRGSPEPGEKDTEEAESLGEWPPFTFGGDTDGCGG